MVNGDFLGCISSTARTRKFPKTEISPLAACKGNLTAESGMAAQYVNVTSVYDD